MPVCCVKGCGTRSSNSVNSSGEKVSFHRIPQDPALLEEFCRRIGRESDPSFQVSMRPTICSLHYKDQDIIAYETGTRRLKPNALPSVFDCRPQNDSSLHEEDALPSAIDGAIENIEIEEQDLYCENQTPETFTMEPVIIISEVKSLAPCSAEAQFGSPPNVHNATNVCVDKNRWHPTRSAKTFVELQRVKADLKQANEKISRYAAEIARLKSQLENAQASLEFAEKDRGEFSFKIEVAQLRYDLRELKADMKVSKEKEDKQSLVEELAAFKKSHLQLLEDLHALPMPQISFETVKGDPKRLKLYTGMESAEEFNAFYDFLSPGHEGKNVLMLRGEAEPVGRLRPHRIGRRRKLSGKSQLLAVLIRLRHNLSEQDLADRFGVSQTTISRVFTSWIQFLYLRLAAIEIWPSKDHIVRTMPDCFKAKYASTRVVIGAIELKSENSKSFVQNVGSHSVRKSTRSLKGLVGMAPNGEIIFVSALSLGSVPNKELTLHSGLLSQEFSNGDSIMADRTFNIEQILPNGVTLNTTPTITTACQISGAKETEENASLLVHVERSIARIKSFKILSQVIPMLLAPHINQIWTVCALLTNYPTPLMQQRSGDSMEVSARVEETRNKMDASSGGEMELADD